MKTLAVDFNCVTEDDCIRLTTRGAARAVAEQHAIPGEWVWLTDGEMEVGARLIESEGALAASPAWETLVDLDPDPGLSFRSLWEEIGPMLRSGSRTREEDVRLLQLLSWFDRLAPEEAKRLLDAAFGPGFTEFRRAVALRALGREGLALQRVERALAAAPDHPEYLALHLELLRKVDLGRAVLEADRLAASPQSPALVIASCINVLGTFLDTQPDPVFEGRVAVLRDWVERFQSAPGRDAVRVPVLALVLFNQGLALLRRGEVGDAHRVFETVLELDPHSPTAGAAMDLDRYDEQARTLADHIREWSPAA